MAASLQSKCVYIEHFPWMLNWLWASCASWERIEQRPTSNCPFSDLRPSYMIRSKGSQ